MVTGLSVAFLLAGALVACGGDDDGEASGDESPSGEAPVDEGGEDAPDEEATGEEGDADSGEDEGDDGAGAGDCVTADQVTEIVGFAVVLDQSSQAGSCLYTSTDSDALGATMNYTVTEGGGSGGDLAMDTARETLEEIFSEGTAEDTDIGDGGFFFDAGIVVQLVFVEDDDLYTIVIGGLENENAEEQLTEMAEALL